MKYFTKCLNALRAQPEGTAKAVLAEAAYRVGTPEPLLQMFVDGDLTVDCRAEEHETDPLRRVGKFADLDPGFADPCVGKLGELHPRAEIFADRSDFTTCRMLTGKPLRCIVPPL